MPTDRGYIREGKDLLQLVQVSAWSGSIAGNKGDRVSFETMSWIMRGYDRDLVGPYLDRELRLGVGFPSTVLADPQTGTLPFVDFVIR